MDVGAVAEDGEVEKVVAAGGRAEGELVLENEGASSDDVVEGEEAFEGHSRIPGAVESVHENFDARAGGGACAMAVRDDCGYAILRRRSGLVMGGGTNDGYAYIRGGAFG